MTSLLQHLDIFELRPLITNLNCKLSTISSYNSKQQLLCLVSEDNEIILRYTDESGQEVLKLISWFRKTHRVLHDVCFDPSGTWLLVLCFDNTLHIVPALAIVDPKKYPKPETSIQYYLYSIKQITSYIIPFVGPHECPNSKKCPNNNANQILSHTFIAPKQNAGLHETTGIDQTRENLEVLKLNENENAEADLHISTKSDPLEDQTLISNPTSIDNGADLANFSHDLPPHMLATNCPPNLNEDKTGNSHVMATSFMASNTCPYPLSVVWWQTLDGVNRAVVGYSDGSICFVGLSPNCPFIANTSIDSGSVVKLLICRDNTFDSVMLLITSSMKRQFKLLLEQKAIRYIYPGEISPNNAQSKDREGEWQIVMPLKRQSNNSDPASDNSVLEEDVFVKSTELPNKANGPRTTPPPSYPISTNANQTTTVNNNINSNNQMPPPPPYSVAINRHLNNNNSEPITTTAGTNSAILVTNTSGVRFQQRHIPDLPSSNNDTDVGILPAARARLASLKSLGSKKLTAIKMRLSDNRQKLEEYLPDNHFSSFAILDSPSVTPEPLGNTLGSFYTIQNLRNTYLLSALHGQSNSLSVHNIDIHLKPVFLYKIPKHCVDILISSNLLYAIQYVDIRTDSYENDHISTEKEKRDVDTEKIENEDIIDDTENKTRKPNVIKEAPSQAKKHVELNGGSSNTENTKASSNSSNSSRSDSCESPSNSINAVGVISSALASIRSGDEQKFNPVSQLALMRFENETVLNLYQMASYSNNNTNNESLTKEEKTKAFAIKEVRSPMDYVKFYETNARPDEELSLRQIEIMITEFPKIKYDPCYVITNKNVYYLQLKKEPFAIFLEAALSNNWDACREFCTTFDLNFELCVEFAGDYLLRRHKVTQALLTYNTARVKPIRTALKLAMYGHTNALLHLCAMALKITYLLKSKYFSHPILKTLLKDISCRHAEDVRNILPIPPSKYDKEVVNEGLQCSDYHYGVDESISSLQMTPSSQFHLANLLLITLAEKAVNDKNYIPLWNFLVTNTKYHTNMTSIVLCQSGLYSAALILAKTRGVCIDTFLAMTSVLAQEFGLYNELNVCLYNLCEPFFIETITYLPNISIDYFGFIQERLQYIRPNVLKLLAIQLNPFSAKLRPIVSHASATGHLIDNSVNENTTSNLYEFCKTLIETYLAILIRMDSILSNRDQIKNAFSTIRINYEDNQFAIDNLRFKPISAGCAHCACVIDGVAYFWGSNGVPCTYSVNKASDPPEPPYAVKTLDLLTQLNLEVHTVKCGRQHSLILTNNGIYAAGNNNLGQLGIGKHMLMSLQPMLMTALDGKNITIMEAGQYHNAVVADGVLYTWGWGVYGQLGHGDTENSYEPKIVKFFKNKKIIQVSLGHGHSLVLCEGLNNSTDLYVFGSNHFGQLGLGSNNTKIDPTCRPLIIESSSQPRELKSLLPIRLDVSDKRIRLIHTKFFTNLVVTTDNRMYTWGSSPQALRLANQIRKRTIAKQKLEEHQRNEMSKRFAATLTIGNQEQESDISYAPSTSKGSDNNPEFKEIVQLNDDNNVPLSNAVETLNVLPEVVQSLADPNVGEVVLPIDPEIIEEAVPMLTQNPSTSTILEQKHLLTGEPLANVAPTASGIESQQQQNPQLMMPEADMTSHLSPQSVDTSEIAGNILQISSGMFHFALITSSCTLYTWGKNLEHQLGTGDKERRPVNKPMPIDTIESPMHVECGSDFTIVMTTDYRVKAFGGNSNGQCGRDLGASIDKMKQRVVCLPTTKRLMRFESQCVDMPVEINLPRPNILHSSEPVRYLKIIPKYKNDYIQDAFVNLELENGDFNIFGGCAASSQQYKSTTTQVTSSDIVLSGQEVSDDLISSLENLSTNDLGSLPPNSNLPSLIQNDNDSLETSSSLERDRIESEQSYQPLITKGENDINDPNVINGDSPSEQNTISSSNDESSSKEQLDQRLLPHIQNIRRNIHYILYIFHGLYNPEKIKEFSQHRYEYRLRVLMLNFKFIEAFVMALEACPNAQQTLRLFEYFTKDTGYVPLRKQDLKYFIYYLFKHFLKYKLDLLECERFLLADLDYYLLELAYVLYFNNNNTVLEQNLNQKFKDILGHDDNSMNNNSIQTIAAAAAAVSTNLRTDFTFSQQRENEEQHKFEDTDVIFDSLTIKFKTIVCQRLFKFINK